MLSEKGIRIQVLSGDGEVKVEEDGYLGKELNDLRIRCCIPAQCLTLCFLVNEKKNVIPIEDRSVSPATRLYVKKVPVRQIYGRVATTEYATNNIRIAIFGQAGKFDVWEAAIVSQDWFFFLTEQETYKSQFFRGENDQILCPDFDEKWPQLMEALKPVMKEENLLPISQYVPSPAPKLNGLQRQQGRVLWWNLALQIGLVALDNKGTVARVHWRSLPPNINGGLRKLEAGQIVAYGTLRELASDSRSKTVSLEAQKVTLV